MASVRKPRPVGAIKETANGFGLYHNGYRYDL